jgi:hypothetical protein
VSKQNTGGSGQAYDDVKPRANDRRARRRNGRRQSRLALRTQQEDSAYLCRRCGDETAEGEECYCSLSESFRDLA